MGHIREVNGLRGVAIISVLFEHLHLGHEPPFLHQQLPAGWDALGLGFFVKGLYWNGWLSVNLFFVLSGFVLFLPYANGSRTLDKQGDWSGYFGHRARRLLPLFYIVICLCTVLIGPMRSVGQTFGEFALYFSGLFHFTKDYFWPVPNTILWSLGVEIWFSALFPFVALSFFRLGAKYTLLACFGFALLARFISVLILPHGIMGDLHLMPFKDTIFGRVDDFAIGMAVAALYVKSRFRSTLWAYSLLVIGGGLTMIGGALWTLQRCKLLPDWSCIFYNIPINLGFGALLLAAVSGNLPKIIGFVLRNPFLQMAGAMCYSIYVWHFVILYQFTQRNNQWPVLGTFFFVTFLVGLLSYRYIEFGNVKDWKKLFPMFFSPPSRPPKSGNEESTLTSLPNSLAVGP